MLEKETLENKNCIVIDENKKVNQLEEENKYCIVIDCCYLFLGSHIKNEKNAKKIYQKIFERNPKNNRSEKMMLECP